MQQMAAIFPPSGRNAINLDVRNVHWTVRTRYTPVPAAAHGTRRLCSRRCGRAVSGAAESRVRCSGSASQPVFEKLADLLGVLITLDETIRYNEHLLPHWQLYRRYRHRAALRWTLARRRTDALRPIQRVWSPPPPPGDPHVACSRGRGDCHDDRMMGMIANDPARFGVDDTKLRQVTRMLQSIEGTVLEGRIFEVGNARACGVARQELAKKRR